MDEGGQLANLASKVGSLCGFVALSWMVWQELSAKTRNARADLSFDVKRVEGGQQVNLHYVPRQARSLAVVRLSLLGRSDERIRAVTLLGPDGKNTLVELPVPKRRTVFHLSRRLDNDVTELSGAFTLLSSYHHSAIAFKVAISNPDTGKVMAVHTAKVLAAT